MYKDKVVDYLHLKHTDGEIGIEVEMEVDDTIPHMASGPWRRDTDGSLRGYSYEWVLKSPVSRSKVLPALRLLKNHLKKSDTEIYDTIRAGVHVHLNMQENTIGEVFKFLMLYYAFETVLVRYCGENREGNLFCMRVRDAEVIPIALADAIAENKITSLRSDNFRYSSINLQSLFQYGSLESRSLATPTNLLKIKEWVDILLALKDYSKNIESCWDSISKISGLGPREWLLEVFGQDLGEKLCYDNLEQDVMYDVRNIQHVCALLKQKGV